jgi:hypothetical protein
VIYVRLGLRSVRVLAAILSRQIQTDLRPLPDLRVDQNLATRLAGETVHHAEPEVGTLAERFGRKKRLKGSRGDLLWQTKFQVFIGIEPRKMFTDDLLRNTMTTDRSNPRLDVLRYAPMLLISPNDVRIYATQKGWSKHVESFYC